MKTLGIIGGIAPESTVAYYRAIIAEYKRRVTDGSQPPVIINSIDMMKMLGMIGEKKFAEVTDYLIGETEKLAKAGAQFGLFASNTPHIVFDRLRQRSPRGRRHVLRTQTDSARPQASRPDRTLPWTSVRRYWRP